MFNKYIIKKENPLEERINPVADAIFKLGETLEANSKADIEARDRVDISRNEYEFMKSRISSLEESKRYLEKLLHKIEFPFDKNVNPESIRMRTNKDVRFHKTSYILEFDVDDYNVYEGANNV